MNTKKKNTSPTMTADKTEPAVRVTETAIMEERTVPKTPKNNPPSLHLIQVLIFEPHGDTADAMMIVNKNTVEVMSAASAAVKGAVNISLTKSSSLRGRPKTSAQQSRAMHRRCPTTTSSSRIPRQFPLLLSQKITGIPPLCSTDCFALSISSILSAEHGLLRSRIRNTVIRTRMFSSPKMRVKASRTHAGLRKAGSSSTTSSSRKALSL